MSDSPKQAITRRTVVGAGAAVSIGLGTGLLGARRALAIDGPIATTAYGKVRGLTNDGVHVFKAVPYGASTTGANRFMAPQPPVAWIGVRDALDYGPSTPQ